MGSPTHARNELLRRLLVLFVFFLPWFVQPVYASPDQELKAARESFLAGEYETAIGQLSTLLYPTSRLAQASAVAEAHLLLGVSLLELGRQEHARREFDEALFLDPDITLDPNVFSAKAIALLQDTRRERAAKAEAAAARERIARKNQALKRAVKNLVVYEKRRYWVNFIPFGAGQFQNGQRTKGAMFFVGESLLGGASVGLWSYQVIRYGFRGTVPRDEVDTVNTIQVFQIATGAAFYGLMAWGIIDSLSNYEHTVTRKADPALLKELEEIWDPSTSFHVLPMAGPEKAGLLIAWDF